MHKHYQKDRKTMNIFTTIETHPLTVKRTIRDFGLRYAYWKLRDLGLSRYQTIRAILLAI